MSACPTTNATSSATTARRFLGERSSSTQVRTLLDDAVGYRPDLWSAMAELGWPAIAVPERRR